MDFATHAKIVSAVNSTPREIGSNLRRFEIEQGFTLVIAGNAAWFDAEDWTGRTIISQDKRRVRLVALEARNPGHGAFTRLIAGIFEAGLTPVLVEPNDMLIDWCLRHDFRQRGVKGRHPHTIWYPRP
jgi:hypothetical protein